MAKSTTGGKITLNTTVTSKSPDGTTKTYKTYKGGGSSSQVTPQLKTILDQTTTTNQPQETIQAPPPTPTPTIEIKPTITPTQRLQGLLTKPLPTIPGTLLPGQLITDQSIKPTTKPLTPAEQAIQQGNLLAKTASRFSGKNLTPTTIDPFASMEQSLLLEQIGVTPLQKKVESQTQQIEFLQPRLQDQATQLNTRINTWNTNYGGKELPTKEYNKALTELNQIKKEEDLIRRIEKQIGVLYSQTTLDYDSLKNKIDQANKQYSERIQ